MFDAHGLSDRRHRGRVFSVPCLNAGFLIGTADEILIGQGFALPTATMEIENGARFGGELRVAWKHPALVSPWLDGIVVEPTPDGGVADVGDDPTVNDLASEIGAAEA